MHWLRVVQSKLCDVLFHAPTDHDPGLCLIVHHGIKLNLYSVTTKMFRDQYFQHGTYFGVLVC